MRCRGQDKEKRSSILCPLVMERMVLFKRDVVTWLQRISGQALMTSSFDFKMTQQVTFVPIQECSMLAKEAISVFTPAHTLYIDETHLAQRSRLSIYQKQPQWGELFNVIRLCSERNIWISRNSDATPTQMKWSQQYMYGDDFEVWKLDLCLPWKM